MTTAARCVRRPTAHLVLTALAAQLLAVTALVGAAPPAGAAAGLTLDKQAPASALAGAPLTYTLAVTNPGDATTYNLSLADRLPPGASYVASSSSPAAAGEPTATVDPATGGTTLVWSNLADLGPQGRYSLSFQVDPGTAGDVVGETMLNSATAATNDDARLVPTFDAQGDVVNPTASHTASDAAATVVSALAVAKSSTNAPDAELLRGVHDQRSTYTVEVTNTSLQATNGVELTDWLPANLEFLACGDVDNTAAGVTEYPGAPRLGVPPLSLGPTCTAPTAVDTVTDPPPANGTVFPPGVYTKVRWTLGSLAAGQSVSVSYVAAVPLRANTDTWPTTRPSAASLDQGANLDNNSGPSTREGPVEASATNRVVATGTYQGATAGGDPQVSAATSRSVSVEDVALHKSVSPPQFASGGVATFTLTATSSEYTSANPVTVTDMLPDGYCPLGGGANFAPGQPATCDPGGGTAPSTPFDSVSWDAPSGAYTIVFTPLSLGTDDTATITFQARMRDTYAATSRSGQPTASGDTFTNQASLAATTSPRAGTGEAGPAAVGDTASATQSTAAPTVQKQLKPRSTSPPATGDPAVDCATNTSPAYGDPATFTDTQRTFRQGDQLCFKLRVTYPATVHTRTPTVTDFLPVGTQYLAGSWAATAASTATIAGFTAPGTAPGAATWTVGTPVGATRFAAPGQVFEVTLAVTVTAPAAPPLPDLTGNLLKALSTNTANQSFSLRADAAFTVAPAANLALQKGVYQVDSPASGPNPPGTDGSQVRQGSTATFRVDVENLGRAGYPGANFSVRGVEVWDVLPPGIDCAAVSGVGVVTHGPVPAATTLTPTALDPSLWDCTDPGDPGHPQVAPAYGNAATSSVLTWAFPSPDAAGTYSLSAGETMTLTYQVAVPDEVSVARRFDNTAAVRSFRSYTNIDGVTSAYYPAQNVDPSVAAQVNAQAASDPSWVATPAATVTKSLATSVVESNNNLTPQATIGETLTWTVDLTVPARTSVYAGTLVDPMPTGVTLTGAAGSFSATGTAPFGALPPGASVNPATGTLTLPATYVNDTADPHVFRLTLTARMSTLGSNTNGTRRTNTATFTSTVTPGGAANTPVTASASATVVEPNPSLTKAASPATAIGGQQVTFTLTASDANGRPPLHDSVAVDCLPAAFTFTGFISAPAATSTSQTPSDGTDGCAVGQTRIEWVAGSILAGTANRKQLVYRATLDPAAVGGSTHTNTATLTGSSINDGTSTPTPTERSYTRTASATVTVTALDLTKGVTPPSAAPGEALAYRVTLRVPAATTYFDAALTDVLPPGVSPAVTTTSVDCVVEGTGDPCTGLDPALGTALTPSGQTVGWLLGDIAADPSNDRFITVEYTTVLQDQPSNSAGTQVSNAATGRWNLADGTSPTTVGDALALSTASTPASATVTVLEPDLGVTKSVDDPTPGPGDTFTYQVVVTNPVTATASEAFDLTASDVVPTGVVVDPASISHGGSITGAGPNGGGTITWDPLDPLAPGESHQLTYQASLAASSSLTAAALVNTAQVDTYASQPSPNPDRRTYSGPSDTATVTPAFPDPAVAKSTPQGDVALVGESFTWSVTVTNQGGATALGVDVTDTLPPNWSYDPGSATVTWPDPGGSPTAIEPTSSTAAAVTTLGWSDLGELSPGQSATITYTATPTAQVVSDPGVGLTVAHTNTAAATADDASGASGNADGPYQSPTASAAAHIAAADVSLTKSPATATVDAGGTATWTLVVGNAGPDPSVAPFTVTDVLPDGFSAPAASGTGWVCTSPTAVVVDCTLDGPLSLAVGGSLPPITVTATSPTGLPGGTVATNTASVLPTTLDPDPSNNTDSAQVTLLDSADLAIAKATTDGPLAGGTAAWSLTVTNNGPDTSAASAGDPITVVDTLPAGATFVAATGTGWSCAAAGVPATGQTVTCTRDTDLATGAVTTVAVVASLPPDASGTLTNTATVTAGETPDPDPSNNTDSVTDPIETSADLSLTKSHTGPTTLGDSVDFTVTVTNAGPSQATGVTVSDPLPDGLTPTAASGTGWSCTITGQLAGCSLDDPLAPGATATVTVTATVTAQAVPTVTNTATVDSSTPDPDPSNNSGSDQVRVPTRVDLSLTKSHTGTFQVGAPGTFTLDVHNAGPTRDPGPVTVTDALPAGLTYTGATGTGWSCVAAAPTSAGQQVECTHDGPLEPGASLPTASLTVTVGPAAFPSATNTATVTSPSNDTDPANNTATDTVEPTADVAVSLLKSGTAVAAADMASRRPGARWSLAVTNTGSSPTVDATTMVDTLPPTLAFVSASGDGWACSSTGAPGAPVTCTHSASIPAGATATVSLLTELVGTTPGQRVTNTAVATTTSTTSGGSAQASVSQAAGSVTAPRAPGDAPPSLARTGSQPGPLALLALALLALGAAVWWSVGHNRRFARRR